MGSAVERPLFADTNLGTHLVVAVPPDITVSNLKKKLGREHSSCFPNLGEIKVHSLLVKRKVHQYHLPDSMPIWHAFHGLRITWFLFMHVSLLERSVGLVHASKWKTQERCLLKEKDVPVSEMVSNHLEGRTGDFEISETAKNRKIENSLWLPETPSGSLCEKVSITRIISNYFPEPEDVDSWSISAENYIKNRGLTSENRVEKSTPVCGDGRSESGFDSPLEIPKRAESYEVGKRLVVAKRKVGLSSGKKLSRASMFVCKRGKQLVAERSPPYMYSVFDISDSDD